MITGFKSTYLRLNFLGFTNSCIIGVSLSEPHHMRSTVKFVFLLACLFVTGIPYMVESRLSANNITSDTWITHSSANHYT